MIPTPQWIKDIQEIGGKNKRYIIIFLICVVVSILLFILVNYTILPNWLLAVGIFTFVAGFFFLRRITPFTFQKMFLYIFYLLPQRLEEYNESDHEFKNHKINAIRGNLVRLQKISVDIVDILESKSTRGEDRGLDRLFVGQQIEFFNKLQELIFRINYFINLNKEVPEDFIGELLDLAQQIHKNPKKFEEKATISLDSLILSLKSSDDGINTILKVSPFEIVKTQLSSVLNNIPRPKFVTVILSLLIYLIISWVIATVFISVMKINVDDSTKLIVASTIGVGIFAVTKKQ